MWNSARCTFAPLIASFALAHGASAVMEEEEGAASEFVRTGFYLGGIIGTTGIPTGWNDDYNGYLNDKATDRANGNAQANLDAIPPPGDSIVPVSIKVNGADLEETRFGLNAVIGYRAGERVAFEVEGEWLVQSRTTDVDVLNSIKLGPDIPGILQPSTGTHTASVKNVWAVTANVKVYPSFTGWLKPLERFQPFAKIGLGVQGSKLVTDIETSGLTTTNTAETIVVPANFQIKSTETNIDGALRLGGGIDIYATENIVSEINATYVMPFSDLGPLTTDYMSVQWRLVYRF